MKIALCFVSGFSTKLNYFEYSISNEMKNQGYNIEIITKDRHPNFFDYENTMEKILGPRIVGKGTFYEDGYIVHRLKTFVLGKNKKLELNFGWLKTIWKIKPDIIFFDSIEDSLSGIQVLIYKFFNKCKIFYIVNEHFIQENPLEKKNKLKIKNRIFKIVSFFLKKFCARYSDKLIGMNEYCFELAKELSKGKNENIIMVTLGVNTDEIYYRPGKRVEIRKLYSVNESEILLIHTGKMHEAKRTDLLIEYLKNSEIKNLKLMLVGSVKGGYKDYLFNLIYNYKIQDKIIYVPFVKSSELHYYFCAADIAVWPDSATISTLEASAVGIPVIVPDFHGYEHRTKFNNGLRVKRSNLEDLTEKLNFLINNKDERLAMGKRGRELVEKELNWNKIVYKIFES